MSDQNAELSRQVQAMSTALRQLEAENARLSDNVATLTVELEARGVELRSARGEAAELAADRARLSAELTSMSAHLDHLQVGVWVRNSKLYTIIGNRRGVGLESSSLSLRLCGCCCVFSWTGQRHNGVRGSLSR